MEENFDLTIPHKRVDGICVPLEGEELAAYLEEVSLQPINDAKFKIKELEKQVTPRRIREAILGIDDGWLSDIEQKIAAQRLIINSG